MANYYIKYNSKAFASFELWFGNLKIESYVYKFNAREICDIKNLELEKGVCFING